MVLPTYRPIVSIYSQKWGVNMRDLTSRHRAREIVGARVEIARSLWNMGYTTVRIGRLLGRDHSTVVYYLGFSKVRFRDHEGITVMAKPKLTNAQRADLLHAQQEGGYQRSRQRAIELGVSSNYGLILADRAARKVGSRKPRKIPERDIKKWERACAVGPVNAGETE